MALNPLRVDRLDYVKSTRVGDASAAPQRPRGLNPIDWLEYAGAHAERLIFGVPKGEVYHVELAERPDEQKNIGKITWTQPGKIYWIDKALKRDFVLGMSLGSFAFMTTVLATGGAVGIGAGVFVGVGALLGGMSDFARNNHEINEGVKIGPAVHINRDALKGALGWGFGIRLALTAGAVGLAAMGVPLLGLETVWAGAAASGVVGQFTAVAQSIPVALSIGTFAVASLVGAVRGSEQGYKRMDTEYVAAKTKSQRPELGVSVEREPSITLPDFALNIVAPTVTASIIAGVGASKMARTNQVDAVDPALVERPRSIDWMPTLHAPASFVAREEQRRPASKDASLSFVQRLQEQQVIPSQGVAVSY